MLEIRRSQERGSAHLDWLDSRHTFSFGNYYDAQQQGFSDLRVINDDWIQPGRGFGMHPHRDMEIFTYVLQGALEHKDSLGTGSVIRPGDVQMMSAGSGITHSEFNPSLTERGHLLQIWIVPNRVGVEPRYQQVSFAQEEKRGQLRLIISPDGQDGSLSIYQDARVYAALLEGAQRASLRLGSERYAYVHVACGSLDLNGVRLETGDGARLRAEETVELSHGNGAEVLVFDLRPHELPLG